MAKVWDDSYYVRIYELTLQGFGRKKIGEILKVNIDTLRYWHDTKPALAEAIERARAQREMQQVETDSSSMPFFDYVYKRLPQELLGVWNELEQLGKGKDAQERVREVIDGHDVRHKQHMFVHAMVNSNFSVAEATRLTGIPRTTWEWWCKDDREFVKLMDEVLKLKKDWVEGALMKLVQKGDKTAVIFANRTLNRDRGYDPKLRIQIEGNVQHNHVDLDNLHLDVETRRKLLEAFRIQQSPQNGQAERPRIVEALPAHQDD